MHSEHLEDDVVAHNVHVDMSNWKYTCFDTSHTLLTVIVLKFQSFYQSIEFTVNACLL